MPLIRLPLPDPGSPDLRTGLAFLRWLGHCQRRGRALAALWAALGLGAQAAVPVFIGLGVQAVVHHRTAELWWSAGGALALGAVNSGTLILLHRQSVWNWIHAASQVRQLVARQASELGGGLSRRIATGEIVAVSSGDVEKIGWYVETLGRLAGSVVVWFGVGVGVLLVQPVLGLAVLLGVPLLAAAVWPLIGPFERRFDRQRELGGKASELAADTVAGLRVLRGIGGEELFLTRYRRASQLVRAAAVRAARIWALMQAQQVLLPGLFVVAVTWYGATLAADGRMSAGTLIAVYGSTAFLALPLRVLGEAAHAWTVARVSAARAVRVLSLSREGTGPADGAGAADRSDGTGAAADGAAGAARANGAGAVELDPERAARSDLHDPESGITARAAEFTAVVCGDPDLAGLLADRLGGHLPGGEASRVRLGGVPLDSLPRDRARALVLVHDKDPVLLSGTLAELMDVPSSGRVPAAEAFAAAQAQDALDALLDGDPEAEGDPMRARITQRGRSLSGGQRQRVALARALIADPPVLVLDEPTSAVDAHTESRVARGLAELRAGRTTVAFATSPLLLDAADRVLFVRDGRVAATGTHRRLLHTEPAYRAVVTREAEEQDVARAPETSADTAALTGDPL
ncbi:ABC transporter transmembrane domain-containing protein [Phaeacidiphilus oryzae]|uniref:ABC transporter transmembrane domain-containing protein n=1 Tax=Phaeacidiphilus oryzae TaxID=348818 RepID=UPI00056CEF2B|nr:ABC transporter ATP-binding protein [Phaeacidiphilus oryzae]